jgi:hypothetical protein
MARKKSTKPKRKCLVDKCKNKMHSRGLCQSCLAAAWGKIYRGETTEAELIQLGLMEVRKPCGRTASGNSFIKAFAKK